MKSILALTVVLIFVQGIIVHAQNNLILGTPFSANVAANQYFPFVFSLAQGGIDDFDLSFQVSGAADPSDVRIFGSFDKQPTGANHTMTSFVENNVVVMQLPRSLFSGRNTFYISVFASEATSFVMNARALNVFFLLELSHPRTFANLGLEGSKLYFEFESHLNSATTLEKLFIAMTHSIEDETQVPFVFIGEVGTVPTQTNYRWTIQGPSGPNRFHQTEIRPAVVGRYYGVVVSRARESPVQFTIRLATTEFLRPEIWAQMWLGAAIGGGVLLVAIIIAISVSCVKGKQAVSVQEKLRLIFEFQIFNCYIIHSYL
jgi:hypothetical protein